MACSPFCAMILDKAVIQVVENNEGIQNKDINRKLTVVRLYNYFDAHKLRQLLLFLNLVAFPEVDIAKDICAGYPDLSVVTMPNGCVLVTKKTPVMDPTAGPIYNPRLLITSSLDLNKHYIDFQVFFKSIFHGSYTTEAIDKYLQTMKIMLSVLAFPICQMKLVLSLRSTENGQYLLYIMTVLIVSYGTNLAIVRDLLMIHCMIAAHHASCCGTI